MSLDGNACYILCSDIGNTTYNGYTNNITRRLRQHNGEIKGGAAATRNKKWHYIVIIKSDDPVFTKEKAMSLEWYIRYPTARKPRPTQFKGAQGRIDSLEMVFQREQFREIPFTVYIHKRYLDEKIKALAAKLPNIILAPLSHLFSSSSCDSVASSDHNKTL
jgi:predicted GIY-YIG superfamily endonuclease